MIWLVLICLVVLKLSRALLLLVKLLVFHVPVLWPTITIRLVVGVSILQVGGVLFSMEN